LIVRPSPVLLSLLFLPSATLLKPQQLDQAASLPASTGFSQSSRILNPDSKREGLQRLQRLPQDPGLSGSPAGDRSHLTARATGPVPPLLIEVVGLGLWRVSWWASLKLRTRIFAWPKRARHSLPHFAASRAIHTITFC
jgi:hypothetical protein